MNGVVSLCHFCEQHGPCVLLSTQAFHDTAPLNDADHQPRTFYGNASALSSQTVPESCEACHALQPSRRGFLSNDHEARVSYLSTRQLMQPEITALVKQACVRSLSCEVSPNKEGPVFFGDDVRGHVLSRTFFLKDAQARGFNRWYSITVLMRDKLYLLNSWPFLVEHIGKMVAELQAKAAQVYDEEQLAQPQRSLRLAAAAASEPTRNKTSRSPADLTGDTLIFPRLHTWFSWLLKAGAERLTERIPDTLQSQNIHQQETEEGFTLVSPAPPTPSPPLSATRSSPTVRTLRHLRCVVGGATFSALVYGLTVGRQVVVRGQPTSLVTSTIQRLEELLPVACRKVVYNSEVYLDSARCNLLGMETRVAVPRLSSAVLRLDILSPDEFQFPLDPADYSYKLNWSGQLPAKCSTLQMKIERWMDNPNLSDGVMKYQLIALREEWLNIAKVLSRLDLTPHGDAHAIGALMQSLGAQEQDKTLINFWATAAHPS